VIIATARQMEAGGAAAVLLERSDMLHKLTVR
jgi:hypothetical protein